MANLAELGVKLYANIKDLQKNLGVAKKSIKDFGDSATSIGTKMTAGLTLPIVGVGASALKTASEFEQLQVRLNTLTGSAEEGTKAFKQLQKFSAGTPFQLDALVQANNTLLGFGMSSEEAFTSLQQLGDVASATGADLQSIAVAFGQSSAEGTLFTRDIRQFINQGVPAVDLLADAMGVARSEVFTLAEAGEISFGVLQKAIADATGEGGKFQNATANQAQTIAGLFSTLRDNVSIAMGELGNEIAEQINIKELIQNITKGIGAITRAFSTMSSDTKRQVLKIAGFFAVGGPIVLALGVLIKMIMAVSLPVVALIAVAGTIGAIFASAFGEAGNVTGAFKLIFAKMANFVVKGIKKITDTLAKLPGGVGKKFQEFSNSLEGFLDETEEQTAGFTPIKDIIDSIKLNVGTLKSVFGDFKFALQDAFKKNPYKKVAVEVASASSNFKDALEQGFTKPVEELMVTATAMPPRVLQPFKEMAQGVSRVLADMTNQLYNTAVDAFTDSLFNVGKFNSEELELRRNGLKQQEIALDESLERQQKNLRERLEEGEITRSEFNERMRLLEEENVLQSAQIQRELLDIEQQFNRQRMSNFRTAMEDMVSAVRQAVREMIAELAKLAVKKGIAKLLTSFIAPGAGGIGGFLLEAFSGRAFGGSVLAGTPYMVGEMGPELFVPNSKGSIMSNRDLMGSMGSKSSGNMNLTGEFRIKGTDLVLALDEANYSLGK